MNVIHTLTLAQMRANPRRTAITLMGVILSVAMLTAVFAGADSFLNLLYRQALAENGSWVGKVTDTGAQVAEKIAGDERVQDTALATSWGLVPLDEKRSWGAAVYGVNDTFYDLLQVRCLEGSLPATGEELAITQTLADKTGWKPGDTVTLDLLRVWTKQSVDDTGEAIYRQRSGFEPVGLASEDQIQELGKSSFTITAIVETSGFESQQGLNWEPCFTRLEQQIPQGGLWCAYFTLDSLDQGLYDLMEDIRLWQSDVPMEAGGAGVTELNRLLLLYHGMDYQGSVLLPAFYGIMGIVLVIILLGAVSLARNAFSISMAQRTRMLGMLASVGATKVQKRQSVLFEALVLGAVGIPLGLAAGCGGMAVTLWLISGTVQEMLRVSQPLYLSVRLLPLAAAVALAALTLAFSALQPAMAASKVGPMDAIRGKDEIRLRAKELKTAGLTCKLFGFTGALALKNCKRNRKRYQAIVFSLTLSVVMLLASSGLSYYVNKAMEVRYMAGAPYATASITFNDPSLDTEEWVEPLTELSGAGKLRVTGSMLAGDLGTFTIPWESISQEARDWIQGQTAPESDQGCTVYPTLLVLEDQEFAQWMGQDLHLDPTCLDCVMVTSTYMTGSGVYAQLKNAFDLPQGFTVDFCQENGYADTWRVAATAEDFPRSSSTVTMGTGDGLVVQLVTSESVFQAFLDRQAGAGRTGNYCVEVQYLAADDYTALLGELEDWTKAFSGRMPQGISSFGYNGFGNSVGLQQLGMVLQVFCTGFVALLCLVCAANIHNTLSAGMELRSREYAVLRSVGVTPGDFRRMLWLESMFYGLKALCWGLPLGAGILLMQYCAVKRAFYFSFSLPLGGILLAVVLVFLVCGISGFLPGRELERRTIVETLHQTIY